MKNNIFALISALTLTSKIIIGCIALSIALSIIIFLLQRPYTFTSRYIQNGPITLWTEAIGNPKNPACLLIAGAGAPALFWTDSFCRILADAGYYVIRFDHRDQGLSSSVDYESNSYTALDLAQDALAILDAYTLTRAHIIGHSMGGMIAQLIAIYHPERIITLTSMSVGTVGNIGRPPQEIMDVLLANKPTQNFSESLPGFMRSWRVLSGSVKLDEAMARDYTYDMYHRSNHSVGVAWNHIKAQEGFHNLHDKLNKIKTPSLFIHGERDPLIPVATGKATADAVPHAQFSPIPGMGHMMFNRNLEAIIAQLLLKHFNQHNSTASIQTHKITNHTTGIIILLNGVSSSGKSAIIQEVSILEKDLKILKVDDWFPEILHKKAESLGWKKETKTDPWLYLHDYMRKKTGEHYFDTELRQMLFNEATELYNRAKSLTHAGYNVIIDTVLEYEKEYIVFDNFFKNDRSLKILIYCPMDVVLERVEKRNASGNPEERRTAFQSFEQFPALFKIQERNNETGVDLIVSLRLKNALDKAIQDLLDHGIPNAYLPKLQKFRKNFISQFNLDKNEEIVLVAKHTYDLILNSVKNTPQESAQKIVDLINNTKKVYANN